MPVEVVSYNVRVKVAGDLRPIEVEAICDDGKLRSGDDCIRRFWVDGVGRPMYLGHLPADERKVLVKAVRDEDATIRRGGKAPPAAESRWSL